MAYTRVRARKYVQSAQERERYLHCAILNCSSLSHFISSNLSIHTQHYNPNCVYVCTCVLSQMFKAYTHTFRPVDDMCICNNNNNNNNNNDHTDTHNTHILMMIIQPTGRSRSQLYAAAAADISWASVLYYTLCFYSSPYSQTQVTLSLFTLNCPYAPQCYN